LDQALQAADEQSTGGVLLSLFSTQAFLLLFFQDFFSRPCIVAKEKSKIF